MSVSPQTALGLPAVQAGPRWGRTTVPHAHTLFNLRDAKMLRLGLVI